MRTCFGMAFLLLILGVAATEAAPPKKAPPAPPPQAALDADKLAPGVFSGTVVSMPNSDRIFTVDVAYQKLQLKPGQNLGRINQGLQRQYNHIMQLQSRAMQPYHPGRRGHPGNNPMAAMQQLQNAVIQFQRSLAQAEANMFQVVNAKQKVDFQVEENVKVRIKELPEQFDDKGNIKKYSREELQELKGKDKNLPGYESSIDNVKPGQIVQVVLAVHRKPRPALKTPTSPAEKEKDADKDQAKETEKETPKETPKDKPTELEQEKDTTLQHKLQVRMIVILKDGDAPAASSKPGKKRK